MESSSASVSTRSSSSSSTSSSWFSSCVSTISLISRALLSIRSFDDLLTKSENLLDVILPSVNEYESMSHLPPTKTAVERTDRFIRSLFERCVLHGSLYLAVARANIYLHLDDVKSVGVLAKSKAILESYSSFMMARVNELFSFIKGIISVPDLQSIIAAQMAYLKEVITIESVVGYFMKFQLVANTYERAKVIPVPEAVHEYILNLNDKVKHFLPSRNNTESASSSSVVVERESNDCCLSTSSTGSGEAEAAETD